MINLNKVRQIIQKIIFCITVNLLCTKFLFNDKLDAYHVGGAIFCGIFTGLTLSYFPPKKKKAILQSN
jgi:hypothetical protein